MYIEWKLLLVPDANEDVIDADKEEFEVNHENQKQGFHKAQQNIPPDQITLMMSLIKKLSIQVEILEQKSMKSL